MSRLIPALASLAALLVAACSPSTASADGSGNVVSQPGIFSYQAPTGWTSEAKEGTEKNSFGTVDCMGPSGRGKISVGVDSVFTVETFTRTYTRSLQPPGNMYQLIDQSAFRTAAGVEGVRFVVTDLENPPEREKITYAFPGTNGATIKVTCTCRAGEDAQLRPVFDASMKTMALAP